MFRKRPLNGKKQNFIEKTSTPKARKKKENSIIDELLSNLRYWINDRRTL